MHKQSVLRKFGFSVFLSSVFLLFTVYNIDFIKSLPIVLQGIAITILAFIQLRIGFLVEFISEQNKYRLLRAKHHRLAVASDKRDRELTDLRGLIISFMEHSEIYREKVKDHLGLGEDYLLIAKSSEGLSDVFGAMGGKVELPFTQVLHELPGSVKPLETMDMFIVPLRNLAKLNGRSLNRFIEEEIIPKVKRRRTRFLNQLPRDISQLADEFSYKYIALLVNRFNFTHNVRNRKFNEAFTCFFVNEHIANDFQELKSDLVEVVQGKDIFELVNWSAFADLNKEQLELVYLHRRQINTALAHKGINKLSDLAITGYEDLKNIIWSVVKRKSTSRKVLNLCVKAIDGAANAVSVLRRNGVLI
jgi:hypothetical protein